MTTVKLLLPSLIVLISFCIQNQHEDVKKQLLDLQLQHNSLKLEHRKTLETHNQKYAQLQQEKDNEVTNLQGKCDGEPRKHQVEGGS